MKIISTLFILGQTLGTEVCPRSIGREFQFEKELSFLKPLQECNYKSRYSYPKTVEEVSSALKPIFPERRLGMKPYFKYRRTGMRPYYNKQSSQSTTGGVKAIFPDQSKGPKYGAGRLSSYERIGRWSPKNRFTGYEPHKCMDDAHCQSLMGGDPGYFCGHNRKCLYANILCNSDEYCDEVYGAKPGDYYCGTDNKCRA